MSDITAAREALRALTEAVDSYEAALNADASAAIALEAAQAKKATTETAKMDADAVADDALMLLVQTLAAIGIGDAEQVVTRAIGSPDYGKVDIAKLLELFKTLLPFIMMLFQQKQ